MAVMAASSVTSAPATAIADIAAEGAAVDDGVCVGSGRVVVVGSGTRVVVKGGGIRVVVRRGVVDVVPGSGATTLDSLDELLTITRANTSPDTTRTAAPAAIQSQRGDLGGSGGGGGA